MSEDKAVAAEGVEELAKDDGVIAPEPEPETTVAEENAPADVAPETTEEIEPEEELKKAE